MAGAVRRWTRRLAAALVALIALVLCVAVAAYVWVTRTERGRELVRREVIGALSGSVFAGELNIGRLDELSLHGLRLSELEILTADGRRAIAAEAASATIRPLALLHRRVEIDSISVEGLAIRARVDEDGALNLGRLMAPSESSGDPSPGWGVAIREVAVTRGRFSLRVAANDDARVVVLSDIETTLGVDVSADGTLTVDLRHLEAGLATPVDLEARSHVAVLPLRLTVAGDSVVVAGEGLAIERTRVGAFGGTIGLDGPDGAPFGDIALRAADVELRPEDLNGFLPADVQLLAPLTLGLSAEGPVDAVELRLPVRAAAGEIDAAITLDLTNPGEPGYQGTLSLRRFVPARWVSVDVDADVSAALRVEGRGIAADSARVSVTADVGPSRVVGFPVDGAWFAASYQSGDVAIDGLNLWTAGASLEGSASLARSGAVRADLTVAAPDLAAVVTRAMAMLPELADAGLADVSGAVRAKATLDGAIPLDQFTAGWRPETTEDWVALAGGLGGTLDVSTHDLVVPGASVADARVTIIGTATEGRPDIGFDLAAAGVRAAGHVLDQTRMRGAFDGERAELTAGVSADGGDVDVSTALAATLANDRVTVELNRLAAVVAGIDAELLEPTIVGISLVDGTGVGRVELASSALRVLGAGVVVGGAYDLDAAAVDVRLDAAELDLVTLTSRLGVEAGLGAGTASVALALRGPLRAPRGEVELSARGVEWSDLSDLGLDLSAALSPGRLEVDARASVRGTEIATLTTAEQALPVNVNLETGSVSIDEHAPLRLLFDLARFKLGTLQPAFGAEVRVASSGYLAAHAELAGTASAPTLSASASLDGASLDLPVGDATPWRVRGDAAVELAYAPGDGFSAAARFVRGGRAILDARGSVDADIFDLVEDPVAVGRRAALDLSATLGPLSVSDLPPGLAREYDVESGEVVASVTWRGTADGGDGTLDVRADGVVVGELPAFDAELAAQAGDRIAARASVALSASAGAGSGGEAASPDAEPDAPPAEPEPARMARIEATLESEATVADLLDDPLGAAVRARLHMPQTALTAFAALLESEAPLGGSAEGYVDVVGTARAPRLFGRFALRGLDVLDDTPGAVAVEVSFDGATAAARVLACDGALEGLDAVAEVDVPWDALVADLEAESDAPEGSAASADGTGADTPDQRQPTAPALESWPLRARVDARAAQLGAIAPVALIAGVASELSGTLDVDLDVSGTVGAPRLVGAAALSGGRVSLVALGRTFNQVSATARFSNEAIALDDLRVEDDRGRVTGSARVTLDDFVPVNASADLRLRDFLAVDSTGAGVIVSGGVALRGTFADEADAFDGSVTLSSLVIDIPDTAAGTDAGPTALPAWVYFVDEDVARDQVGEREPRRVVVAGETTSAPSTFVTTLHITTDAPADVHQQLAELRFTVDLRLRNGPDGMTLDGRVTLPSGRVRVAGNAFEIERGVVVFSPDDVGVDPQIDVLAVHALPSSVSEYLSSAVSAPSGDVASVRVTVRGRLTELAADPASALVLASDPGMSEADIFQVLASGRLSSDSSTEEAQQGFAALSSLLLGVVGDQLSSGIPIDTLRIESTSDTQRVEGGKYIADNLYMSGTYIRSPDVDDDNNFEVSLDWILRQIGPGSLRLELRGGDRAKGGVELLFNVIRAARVADEAAP
ncbi:MAG: translocation/assembly module TamB domain-containing protein [Myxococcales bacterium]|nr:translocation/assembly module TamB domain-containing protein [Myxococcales bacterium]